ncbi:MAG: DUF4007 family protein [Bacteroides sp]|nr:DUF4007 family protein [Bacteroides sp.]
MKYVFSGHESFPCKTLWLKKGYDFVVHNKDFNNPEAVIDLGVGKNMVASIRYWLKVFGLCQNDQPTWLGNYLFNDENGRDPYMEDLATLWILHFHLVFNQDATLYNLFFCGYQKGHTQFEREQIVTYVKLNMIEANKQNVFNENTVKKDVSVLIQNYALPRKYQSNEDFSSLLIDLDLIRQNTERKGYYINIDGKRKVAKEIFMYALLVLKEQEGDNTISYDTVQDKVGLTFCMQDYETIEILKLLANEYSNYMSYSDNAGIRMIQFTQNLGKEQVLNDYYEAHV